MAESLYRLWVAVPAVQADAAVETLCACDLSAVSWEDVDTGKARVDVYVEDADEVAAQAVIMEAQLRAVLGVNVEVHRETLAPEDWTESWKRFFHVERVSRRIVIKPSWEPFEPGGSDCVVEIDPGMSFGTGLHGTTRGCLRCLDELADQNTARSVLDMGCGSGILSIAAAKLGFVRVSAFDYDPVAVRISEQNATLNGVADRMACAVHDLASGAPAQRGEIVIANILAHILCEHAEAVVGGMRGEEGDVLLLSGILDKQYAQVLERFVALGLREERNLILDGWRTGWFVKC